MLCIFALFCPGVFVCCNSWAQTTATLAVQVAAQGSDSPSGLVVAGFGGFFQKPTLARILRRDTEGVRSGAPAPPQAIGTGRILSRQPADRLPAGEGQAIRSGDAGAGTEDGCQGGAPVE